MNMHIGHYAIETSRTRAHKVKKYECLVKTNHDKKTGLGHGIRVVIKFNAPLKRMYILPAMEDSHLWGTIAT